MVNGKNTRCKVAEVIEGLEINTDYIEMEGFGKNAIFDMFVQVSASWQSLKKQNRQQPEREVLYEIAEILNVEVKDLLIERKDKK